MNHFVVKVYVDSDTYVHIPCINVGKWVYIEDSTERVHIDHIFVGTDGGSFTYANVFEVIK